MVEQWIPIVNGILLLILFIYLLRCWQRGFVIHILELLSWLFAALIAWMLSGWLAQEIELIHLTPSKIEFIDHFISTQASTIAWFLIVLFGLRLVVIIIHPFAKAIDHLPLLGWLNHFAGIVLGMGKACIIGYFLLVFFHLPLFEGSGQLAQQSILGAAAPIGEIALNSGGSMLERLQLIEKMENNEKMDDDSLQQLKAWLYGKGGEEEAVFHWLESLH